jgi:hypothetical protein
MVMILAPYGETLWIHNASVLLSRESVWQIAEEYNSKGWYKCVTEGDF